MQDAKDLTIIFDGAAADGVGNTIYCEDYDVVLLQFGSASSANLTCNFVGSLSDTAPAFGSAKSVSNHWDNIDIVDLENGTSIDGDTGIALAGTDDFRNFELNLNGIKYINAVISSYVAGNLTVKAKLIKRN